MENLKRIIEANNVNVRPEYYSGRGATTSDLDGTKLEGIYQGIKSKFGEKAAESYVKMVDGMKVMSATAFLNELYSLSYSDWKYKKKKSSESGISVKKNKNGQYDVTHGMVSMLSAMMNNGDETRIIKWRFCRNHGIKAKSRYERDDRGFQIRNW